VKNPNKNKRVTVDAITTKNHSPVDKTEKEDAITKLIINEKINVKLCNLYFSFANLNKK
jgi:hypothetical protein